MDSHDDCNEDDSDTVHDRNEQERMGGSHYLLLCYSVQFKHFLLTLVCYA